MIISKKNLKHDNNFIFISSRKTFFPIKSENIIKLEDLIGIEEQKKLVLNNSYSFLSNQLYNNVLLWGAKGMGKSSLILSTTEYLNTKHKGKLILLELLSTDLKFLPEIVYKLRTINQKFIIYIDDITLNVDEYDFKIFKSCIEGSQLSYNKNIVFYITSNIRNVIKPSRNTDLNDIQIKDKNNNAISLSDRFGLWVSFHKCNKRQYLEMIHHNLKKQEIKYSKEFIDKRAIQWSIEKGDFSGRIANQFIINLTVEKEKY